MPSFKINLLPPEIKKRRKAERNLIVLISGFLLFFAVLTLFTLALSFKAGQEETKLRGLTAKTGKIKHQVKNYRIFKKRKEEVDKHKEVVGKAMLEEISWQKIFNEVSMIIPSEVWLSKIEVEESTIVFEGVAYRQSAVAKFMVRLSELSYLSNLWLEESQREEIELDSEIPQYQIGKEAEKPWALKFKISSRLPMGSGGEDKNSQAKSSQEIPQ